MDLIGLALEEDLGTGDVTTAYFTEERRLGQARIFAREAGILAGVETAMETFRRVDSSLILQALLKDGAELMPGDAVLAIQGTMASLLTAERVALNFLQRLSGVATFTGKFVRVVHGTGALILDTRKTTPGWRSLEKAAVRAGGGSNHRLGLHDMVMVKDNHLAAGTGNAELQAAIARVKRERPELRVELEADTLDQVREFITLEGVDIVLLDNMSLEELRTAVSLRPAGLLLEASGGVTLESVREIAETGVDRISVGALTHSAPALDLALEIEGIGSTEVMKRPSH